jgi:hypothetical protein
MTTSCRRETYAAGVGRDGFDAEASSTETVPGPIVTFDKTGSSKRTRPAAARTPAMTRYDCGTSNPSGAFVKTRVTSEALLGRQSPTAVVGVAVDAHL